jgi:hypothetical protein
MTKLCAQELTAEACFAGMLLIALMTNAIEWVR